MLRIGDICKACLFGVREELFQAIKGSYESDNVHVDNLRELLDEEGDPDTDLTADDFATIKGVLQHCKSANVEIAMFTDINSFDNEDDEDIDAD